MEYQCLSSLEIRIIDRVTKKKKSKMFDLQNCIMWSLADTVTLFYSFPTGSALSVPPGCWSKYILDPKRNVSSTSLKLFKKITTLLLAVSALLWNTLLIHKAVWVIHDVAAISAWMRIKYPFRDQKIYFIG